jgi:hypothetical protein
MRCAIRRRAWSRFVGIPQGLTPISPELATGQVGGVGGVLVAGQ